MNVFINQHNEKNFVGRVPAFCLFFFCTETETAVISAHNLDQLVIATLALEIF